MNPVDGTTATEFERQVARQVRRVLETGRTEVFTSGGRSVVIADSKKLTEEAEIQRTLEMIQASEADIAVGRVMEAKEAMYEIADEVVRPGLGEALRKTYGG